MRAAEEFLDRVFQRVPATLGSGFDFQPWRHAGRPTSEGLGMLATSVSVDALAARILDVDHYTGNIDYVVESRVVPGPPHDPPRQVRFYQRIKVPVLAEIQQELLLRDHGERQGWRVLAWQMLDEETAALDPRRGARSEYNVGAWLLRPDAVGYALSSAPRKSDVGRLRFKALTRGADASAAKVVKGNIAGMVSWARRS